MLRARNVALCIADSEKMSTPVEITADYAYFRLRDEGYQQADIERWAARSATLQGVQDVFVYFKHEEQGLGPEFRAAVDGRAVDESQLKSEWNVAIPAAKRLRVICLALSPNAIVREFHDLRSAQYPSSWPSVDEPAMPAVAREDQRMCGLAVMRGSLERRRGTNGSSSAEMMSAGTRMRSIVRIALARW